MSLQIEFSRELEDLGARLITADDEEAHSKIKEEIMATQIIRDRQAMKLLGWYNRLEPPAKEEELPDLIVYADCYEDERKYIRDAMVHHNQLIPVIRMFHLYIKHIGALGNLTKQNSKDI